MHQLLHGHIRQAIALNAMAVVAMPVFLVVLLCFKQIKYHKFTPLLYLLAYVLFGIARNLPSWPFCDLAPH